MLACSRVEGVPQRVRHRVEVAGHVPQFVRAPDVELERPVARGDLARRQLQARDRAEHVAPEQPGRGGDQRRHREKPQARDQHDALLRLVDARTRIVDELLCLHEAVLLQDQDPARQLCLEAALHVVGGTGRGRGVDFAEQVVAGLSLVAQVREGAGGGTVEADGVCQQALQPLPDQLLLQPRAVAPIQQVLEGHHAHVVERAGDLDAVTLLGDGCAHLGVGPDDADGDDRHGAEHQPGGQRGLAADLHRTTVTRSGLTASSVSSARWETKSGMGWRGA